jgi:uncharacterized protein YgiM (DUF1202 family)
MPFRNTAAALIVLFALAGIAGAEPVQASIAADSPGVAHFFFRQLPSFDSYTNDTGNATLWSWMNEHFWRAMEYTTYFDSRTSLYSHALLYDDSYAIYKGSSWQTDHPEWILTTGANGTGDKVFIDWGCSGGTCPQYAADVSNPDFRQAWIDQAKEFLARGRYKGLWIDDVNMAFRFTNGSSGVTPWDPNTGAPMTEANWQKYMAEFMEEIRAQLPDIEILHNAIWYAGGGDIASRASNPYVKREEAAADLVDIERGVNDSGLTGGTGYWSYREVLNYIDRIHALGKGVVLDAYAGTETDWQYSLASYYLISTGRDALGAQDMTPDNWWDGFDTDLGTPSGARYDDPSGLIRRDYSGGIALVNPPDGVTRTITLPKAYDTIDSGSATTSVTLASARGIVLLTPPPPPSPPPQSSGSSGSSGSSSSHHSSTSVVEPVPPSSPQDGAPAFEIGARIRTTSNLNVRTSASVGAPTLGVAPLGVGGTVEASPIIADSYRWWEIDYDNGLSGWSVGDYLTAASTPSGTSGSPASSQGGTSGLSAGARIATASTLNVRSSATLRGALLGAVPQGSGGTVVSGPSIADSYAWWEVNYDNGLDGWSAADYLLPSGAAAQSPLAKGAKVTVLDVLNVRSAASTGALIAGAENTGSTGTVVSGPAAANGYTWWEINYDDGLSGWSVGNYLQAAQ